MNAKTVFFNDYDRLRSGWRLLIFLCGFIVIALALGTLVFFVFSPDQGTPTPAWLTINAAVSLAAAILVGWLCGRYLENVPFRALGCWFTEGWLKHLCQGSLVGILAIAVAVAIAAASGGLSFRFVTASGAGTVAGTLTVSLIVFAAAAAFEEALFRGYMLQTFARADLAWLAIVLTAAFFGIVHLGNKGADVVSTLNTVLAGIWFGLAYLRTRDLWFPFGMHLMWNWVQGSVFGIEVSGYKALGGEPLLTEIDRGPALITGENYGIEAAIPATIAIILAIAAIQYWKFIRPDPEMLALTTGEKPRPTVS